MLQETLDESADKTRTLLFTAEVIQASPSFFSLLASALAQMQICKAFRIKPETEQTAARLVNSICLQTALISLKKNPREGFNRKGCSYFASFSWCLKTGRYKSYMQDSWAFPPSIN